MKNNSPLLLEVHCQDGHRYRFCLDGTSSGFPDGSLIVNHARPLFDKLLSSAGGLSMEESVPHGRIPDE